MSDIHIVYARFPSERVAMVKVRVQARSPCLTSYFCMIIIPSRTSQHNVPPFFYLMPGQVTLSVALIRRRLIGAKSAVEDGGGGKSIEISLSLTLHVPSSTPFRHHLSRMDKNESLEIAIVPLERISVAKRKKAFLETNQQTVVLPRDAL